MRETFPYHLHALHGFLGTPGDWGSFPFVCRLSTYHLFQDFPITAFPHWAATFNRHVLESGGRNKESGKHILMGYSLGGRLGLHAVLENPALWDAAIFISTHPGLPLDTEKRSRLTADRQWAERFEKESWTSLMQAWNAQEVFKGDSWKREENDFDRASLAYALQTWSLGAQEDLSEAIQELNIPFLWMVGANDLKFLHQAEALSFKHPKSRLCVIPEASHRLPWQQPETFMSYLTQFMHNLEQ